jgi:anti-sigma factor ChrR (cupin superfamily)
MRPPLAVPHFESNPDLQELASLYALGTLSEDEKAAFEAHLSLGCPVCESEVTSFRRVTGAIAQTASPIHPRHELRERLMKAVAQPELEPRPLPAGVIFDRGGVFIARAAEMNWQNGPLPGVFAKVLFQDSKRDYTTAVVRMVAGTHYLSHRHAGVEELFLLEGDLSVGEQQMRPGDYCRGEEGSVHQEIVTKSGCLFIATASNHDEMFF